MEIYFERQTERLLEAPRRRIKIASLAVQSLMPSFMYSLVSLKMSLSSHSLHIMKNISSDAFLEYDFKTNDLNIPISKAFKVLCYTTVEGWKYSQSSPDLKL